MCQYAQIHSIPVRAVFCTFLLLGRSVGRSVDIKYKFAELMLLASVNVVMKLLGNAVLHKFNVISQ